MTRYISIFDKSRVLEFICNKLTFFFYERKFELVITRGYRVGAILGFSTDRSQREHVFLIKSQVLYDGLNDRCGLLIQSANL